MPKHTCFASWQKADFVGRKSGKKKYSKKKEWRKKNEICNKKKNHKRKDFRSKTLKLILPTKISLLILIYSDGCDLNSLWTKRGE